MEMQALPRMLEGNAESTAAGDAGAPMNHAHWSSLSDEEWIAEMLAALDADATLPGMGLEEWLDQALATVDTDAALAVMGDWESLDWANLRHAYGAADDLPAMVYALFSRDAEAVDEVFSSLVNRILHQGSVYSATMAVVPYLHRMLLDGRPLPRHQILRVLIFAARCSAAEPTPPAMEVVYAARAAGFARQGKDFGAYLAIQRAIYRFLCAHQGSYEQLLSDPDPEVREATTELLRTLHDKATETPPKGWEKGYVEDDDA